MQQATILVRSKSSVYVRGCCGIVQSRYTCAQVLRRMALVPEAEADELEALGERVAVAAAAGVEADAEMGEVPDEFTVSAPPRPRDAVALHRVSTAIWMLGIARHPGAWLPSSCAAWFLPAWVQALCT